MKINDSYEYIVGIIDSYGAVHSKVSNLDEQYTHSNLFPSNIFKRWSWHRHTDLTVSVLSSKFDDEEIDKVVRHLKRKYGIID